MLALADVQRLFAFHHWATDRAFDALSVVTAEQLDRAWGGSFGTGRALLQHVVGVEQLWCERWNGRSPREIPDFAGTSTGHDFAARWEQIRSNQRRVIETLTEERLAAPLAYVNLKGIAWTYPMHEIMQHCVNHGTYHRGQITHLLRDLGILAPQTDWLVFIDQETKSN